MSKLKGWYNQSFEQSELRFTLSALFKELNF